MIRLTVVVGVVIGVMVGLIAAGGRGVVSAVIVIALANRLVSVSWQAGRGTYLAIGAGAGHIVAFSTGSG